MPPKPQTSRSDSAGYDLVVVGAGIAGLNALNAASDYLPKGARVLLLDQKEAPGGMWNTAYDYVRLHQPYPMFTVGNMKWAISKPRDYLATRDEVQMHLSHALGPIGETVTLKTKLGHTVSRCLEIDTPQGPWAEVSFHPNDQPDAITTVQAARAIYASGLNYAPAEPLPLSSRSVVSIIPQELRDTLVTHPGAAVIVVGGGKTAMDTILATLETDPRRKILLLKGRGTNFLDRTKYLPTGLKRWTSGALVSRLFRDLALNFDGDNEDHTMAHLRAHHSTDPDADNQLCVYGLQSEDELARIKDGVSQTVADYLSDVIDTPDGPHVTLRSGAHLAVDAGSIVVNCTGSFFRTKATQTPRPILSPHGCVLSINPREGFHFLTSVAAFFMTHLLYRDRLVGPGFYTLDHEALFRQDRGAWLGASAAQAYLNQVLAVQTLPLMLLNRCGLDLDRWYPFPRRMAALVQMKATASADIAHCRRALDRVGERFGVATGPLG